MDMADKLNDTLWKAIISGNIGQIYYLQKNYSVAKPLLIFDYSVSKDRDEQISAANSLQWVARINLAEGKKDSALIRIQEALRLMQKKTDQAWAYYWQNVYYAAADIYRAFGYNDSVYKYTELYTNLHDSMERAVADSRLEISRIKLDNLQNALAIKNLQKEKQATELTRNFVLLAIILAAVMALFILNRQRLKLAYKQKMAEAETNLAREQMASFRQNIIEKTSLIEKLQEQVQDKATTAEQLTIIDELSQHTILTEADWDKFKNLFEKIYPGFFIKLKGKSPDITIAEQRMAALTRMNLTTRQIATMLGISVDSVHKARQRLRQRLNFSTEARLEEFIGSF
jgi:DNA-binding CsgD family transcriptional regulator